MNREQRKRRKMDKEQRKHLQEISESEQEAAQLGRNIVPYLAEFYKESLGSGFNESQAFELTKAVLQSLLRRVQ